MKEKPTAKSVLTIGANLKLLGVRREPCAPFVLRVPERSMLQLQDEIRCPGEYVEVMTCWGRIRVEPYRPERRTSLCSAAAESDEAFARFVFAHFGGYWLNSGCADMRDMKGLPRHIRDRVTELARELELDRGGP